MDIHNIVEDVVREIVADVFAKEDTTKELGYCTCGQCQLDVACYVLNRMKSEYVISGRGAAHSSQDWQDNIQRQADAVVLANEGWRKINQARRPHFRHGGASGAVSLPKPPVYNFPTVLGRVFNGTTFEPMGGIQVCLYREGEVVPMIDPNWQNPCSIFGETNGTFIFWPMPDKAEQVGDSLSVEFELRAEKPGFEGLQHFFSIRLQAEMSVQDQFSLQRQHTLKDLTMFPLDEAQA